MAADCSKLEVMNFATSFGSAVLGTLNYDDDEHNWLLEFGHIVANYEYLRAYPERDQQDLQNIISRISNISVRHRIGDNQGDIIEIRRFVKAIHKENSYGIFLIAGCSWYLSKSRQLAGEPKHSGQLECAALGYLKELEIGCPTLSINQDVLWAKIYQKLSEYPENSVHNIRKLLQDLCRALEVLLVSADPKDTFSARSDGERRSLSKALSETMFRHKVNVKDIHGCQVSDIANALIQHKPDILQFLGHGDKDGIYFEDRDSKAQLVRMENFADLLSQSKTIKLVILNTCYSRSGSQCIADQVGYLIGMEGKIRNKDAIKFTECFYGALGNGLTVEGSFLNAGYNMKVDSEARFQAHLLRKGQAPITISTTQTAGNVSSEYRGLCMNVKTRPFVISVLLSLLATAAYFRNIFGPVKAMINLWRGP
ncbi:hypothetical protein F5B19DRAFT_488727 [Rostrohypoxylon terebratum]|nr:hypothetical protein F5B19DRAFT_488727 [Rostrohypoxylon terebratum]